MWHIHKWTHNDTATHLSHSQSATLNVAAGFRVQAVQCSWFTVHIISFDKCKSDTFDIEICIFEQSKRPRKWLQNQIDVSIAALLFTLNANEWLVHWYTTANMWCFILIACWTCQVCYCTQNIQHYFSSYCNREQENRTHTHTRTHSKCHFIQSAQNTQHLSLVPCAV